MIFVSRSIVQLRHSKLFVNCFGQCGEYTNVTDSESIGTFPSKFSKWTLHCNCFNIRCSARVKIGSWNVQQATPNSDLIATINANWWREMEQSPKCPMPKQMISLNSDWLAATRMARNSFTQSAKYTVCFNSDSIPLIRLESKRIIRLRW